MLSLNFTISTHHKTQITKFTEQMKTIFELTHNDKGSYSHVPKEDLLGLENS